MSNSAPYKINEGGLAIQCNGKTLGFSVTSFEKDSFYVIIGELAIDEKT
jgi:hypothetical protein